MYKDYRAAVLDILSTQDNQEAELNGIAGMGRGSDDIPGSIVSVDTAPSPQRVVTEQPKPAASKVVAKSLMDPFGDDNPGMSIAPPQPLTTKADAVPSGNIPPVIFVIGGPGSNKATLCLKVVGNNAGWTHFRYVSSETLHCYFETFYETSGVHNKQIKFPISVVSVASSAPRWRQKPNPTRKVSSSKRQ